MNPSTRPIRAAVLTVSDRCAAGTATDRSGPELVRILTDRLHATVAHTATVPDDHDRIAQALLDWASPERNIDLVCTTGGTGLAPRDITPEAAASVFHRHHNALMELARLRCLQTTPLAFLSRGVAGVRNRTLILTLPGSPRGAADHLLALLDVLPHAIDILRGNSAHHAPAP